MLEVAKEILANIPLAQLLAMPLASLAGLRGMGVSRAAVLLAAARTHPANMIRGLIRLCP